MKNTWNRFDQRRGHETKEFMIDIWGLIRGWISRRRKKENDERERKQVERRRALHKEWEED